MHYAPPIGAHPLLLLLQAMGRQRRDMWRRIFWGLVLDKMDADGWNALAPISVFPFLQSNLSIPKIFEAINGITGAQRTFDTDEPLHCALRFARSKKLKILKKIIFINTLRNIFLLYFCLKICFNV